jgi:hypothetical protein
MNELRFTLLSDGSSDRALMPILSWLLAECGVRVAIQEAWAELRGRQPRSSQLAERVKLALQWHPCDLLFVHRDAEKETLEVRKRQILEAISALCLPSTPPAVCVVPVRMQEAWLMFDEPALRTAAGNPNNDTPLELPALASVERLADPKDVLLGLMRRASGFSGRRLRNFRPQPYRIVQLIDDFSPLRQLPAFQALEADLLETINANGWAADAALTPPPSPPPAPDPD